MTFAEINRKFTEIVSDYLAHGWVINAGTMNGSQGEVTKVDLTDGHNVLRVLVTEGYNTDDEYWLYSLKIVVGAASSSVAPNKGTRQYDTIWNNRLTILREEEFYKVGDVTCGRNAGEQFYGTRTEAIAAHNKHLDRYTMRNSDVHDKNLTELAREIGVKYIRRKLGIMRVNKAALSIYKNQTAGHAVYTVIYRGKSYNLH